MDQTSLLDTRKVAGGGADLAHRQFDPETTADASFGRCAGNRAAEKIDPLLRQREAQSGTTRIKG